MDYITNFAKTLVSGIFDIWYEIWSTDVGSVAAGLCLAFFTATLIFRFLVAPITGGVISAGSDYARTKSKEINKAKRDAAKKNGSKGG